MDAIYVERQNEKKTDRFIFVLINGIHGFVTSFQLLNN